MSKLSNIFHNNIKYNTNNKNSFSTSKKEVTNPSLNIDNLINYFNKSIIIELNNGTKIEGVLLSKRDDIILLDTGDHIDIKEILSIK